MGFEFLTDTANDMLELCQRAKAKKDKYIKSLGRAVSKKEDEELTDRFVQEELNVYLQNRAKHKQVKKAESIEYPDITKDYEMDSLEFDELQDMLDDDDYDNM